MSSEETIGLARLHSAAEFTSRHVWRRCSGSWAAAAALVVTGAEVLPLHGSGAAQICGHSC